MSLTLNSTAIKSLNVDGTICKRLVLNNQAVWAKEYTLSINPSKTAASVPATYVVRTASTDLKAPVGGNPAGKCYHEEQLNTVLLMNDNTVFYPSGNYSISGNTTINANVLTAYTSFPAIHWDSENAAGHDFAIEIRNPYFDDHNDFSTLKYPPSKWSLDQESLEDHCFFYIQIVSSRSGTASACTTSPGSIFTPSRVSNANGYTRVNFGVGSQSCWMRYDSTIQAFKLSLRDMQANRLETFTTIVSVMYEDRSDIAVRTAIAFDYNGASVYDVILNSIQGSQGVAEAYMATLPTPWIVSSST